METEAIKPFDEALNRLTRARASIRVALRELDGEMPDPEAEKCLEFTSAAAADGVETLLLETLDKVEAAMAVLNKARAQASQP